VVSSEGTWISVEEVDKTHAFPQREARCKMYASNLPRSPEKSTEKMAVQLCTARYANSNCSLTGPKDNSDVDCLHKIREGKGSLYCRTEVVVVHSSHKKKKKNSELPQ
jgi:5-methylcytosine-specific restriction endonuclease McrA